MCYFTRNPSRERSNIRKILVKSPSMVCEKTDTLLIETNCGLKDCHIYHMKVAHDHGTDNAGCLRGVDGGETVFTQLSHSFACIQV